MNFKRIIDYALSGNLWYTHKSLNLIWTRTSHNQLAIFCKHQELQKAQSGGLGRSISTSSDISVEEVEHKDNEISKLKEIVKDYWLKIEVSVFPNSSNALIPAESQNVGARLNPRLVISQRPRPTWRPTPIPMAWMVLCGNVHIHRYLHWQCRK